MLWVLQIYRRKLDTSPNYLQTDTSGANPNTDPPCD